MSKPIIDIQLIPEGWTLGEWLDSVKRGVIVIEKQPYMSDEHYGLALDALLESTKEDYMIYHDPIHIEEKEETYTAYCPVCGAPDGEPCDIGHHIDHHIEVDEEALKDKFFDKNAHIDIMNLVPDALISTFGSFNEEEIKEAEEVDHSMKEGNKVLLDSALDDRFQSFIRALKDGAFDQSPIEHANVNLDRMSLCLETNSALNNSAHAEKGRLMTELSTTMYKELMEEFRNHTDVNTQLFQNSIKNAIRGTFKRMFNWYVVI